MIEYVAETGSTNADLLDRLRRNEEIAEGHWLVADRQTNGRGRQGRDWRDGAGNFMGSTVARLRQSDHPASSLALVAGIATFEAVRRVVPQDTKLALKWPNDLMVAGAKLAGMLLERRDNHVVVGIGVNLKTAPELSDRPTASLATTTEVERNRFAEELADAMRGELERWRAAPLVATVQRWERYAHPRGTALDVRPPGESCLSGSFDGLTEDGALRLRLLDGTSRVIHAGDVFLL